MRGCQCPLNLPLSFQLCVCVKVPAGKVGSRYNVEVFSALEMLPAHFLWGLWQMLLQTLYCENGLCFLFALCQQWPLVWLQLELLLLVIAGWRSWRCKKDANVGSCCQPAFVCCERPEQRELANLDLRICWSWFVYPWAYTSNLMLCLVICTLL